MRIHEFNNTIPDIEYFNYRQGTPDWHIEQTKIHFTDLTYITGGRAVYTINHQKIQVEKGDLLCIPSGSLRDAGSSNAGHFECFAANFVMRGFSNEEIPVPLPILSHVGNHSDIISQYRKLYEEYVSRSPGYIMRTRARFMLILQRFMDILIYAVDTHRFDPRVKQAIIYITDNYAEHLTIAEVAAQVSLNPVYFGALFKKETGVTFRDYLNTVRLNQAEDMLRAGRLNVSEVAASCGFADVFYFSRLFKKYKGIPPSLVQ